jgi:hypothetical protein
MYENYYDINSAWYQSILSRKPTTKQRKKKLALRSSDTKMQFTPIKPITNCAQKENTNHSITAHFTKTQSLHERRTEHQSPNHRTSKESSQHTKTNDSIKQIYIYHHISTQHLP